MGLGGADGGKVNFPCRSSGGRVTEVADKGTMLPAHRAAVEQIKRDYAAIPPGSPVRLAKRTSNLFRFRGETAGPGAGRIGLRPRPAGRPGGPHGRRRRHDHLRGPGRRHPAARPDAAGRPAAQDDHPRRRGQRARHRVHLAAQRDAARVRAGDGDPDRRRPGRHRRARRRARRALPRVPQLLRHPGLRPVADHRAASRSRRTCTCGTSASAARRTAWRRSPRSPPTAATRGIAPTSSTAPCSAPTSCT